MTLSPNKIVSEGDNFYTIKSVPIFECHDSRGFDCNEEWMRECVQNFEQDKVRGHRPTIILGHNVKGVEKPAKGFLDNLVLRGKRLYADLVRVPKKMKDLIVENAYPSRSVEVLPNSKRILALALLGGTAPYFSLPQMVYSREGDEQERSIWYRSPTMNLPSNKNANQNDVAAIAARAAAEAVAQYQRQQESDRTEAGPEIYELTIPQGAQFIQDNPNAKIFQADDGLFYAAGDEGEYYQIPQEVLSYGGFGEFIKGAGKKIAEGTGYVGRKAKGGYEAAKGAKLGTRMKGAFRDVSEKVATHPKAAVAALGAGTATGGYVAGRMHEKRRNRYQLDENSGIVYFDGYPVGEVQLYNDGVSELPNPNAGGDPDLVIEEGAVGRDSGTNPALQNPVSEAENTFVDDVDRESSDQFSLQPEDVVQYVEDANEATHAETYQLQQEVEKLKYANSLLTVGRKAEQYKQYLLSLKQAGAPIGDIDQTVDYMLGLNDEQVKKFMKVTETAPKIQLGKTNYSQPEENASQVKAEFNANRETYSALGVSESDLKYAGYVRVNNLQGSSSNNGAPIAG